MVSDRMVNGVELLDNSSSMFAEVDIYDNNSDEWYHGYSKSFHQQLMMGKICKEIHEHVAKSVAKRMKGPEIFDAEVVIHDVT